MSEITAVINLQELHSLEDLAALDREWADLWSRCPQATPFQSPDWVIPLCTHVGEGELWVVTMRHENRLVGMATFHLRVTRETGLRHLFLLGTGVTDYLDVLFDPDFASQCIAALLGCLSDHRDRWDLCDWQQLRGGSFLLAQDTPVEWSSQISVQEVCPVLLLPDEVQGLSRNVPLRMLEKLRYFQRQIRRLGLMEFELARLDTFAEIFGRFIELHQARWSLRGQAGVLALEPLQRFHRDAAQRMLLSGTLRLYGLRSRGEIIAALYAFAHRGYTYYYLSGFDPGFAPYSPVTLLIGHAVEEAIREGSKEFDFLRGREAYKYMWGARGRLNYRRQFWHSQ